VQPQTHAPVEGTYEGTEDCLVAIFGHELRSHLAPIKNASELLKRSTLDPAMVRQSAGIIERQVDGMTRLVDELLAAALSHAVRPKLRRADVALDRVIRRSVEIVEPLVSSHDQTLVISLPSEPIRLEADEIWLARALQNVIGNATKYTDPGGRIELDAKLDGTQVVITVRDTGVGLAPAELETIFDLYMQIPQPATRTPADGLGVGLHLTRFLIEAHGGSIHAMSEGPERGSTFIIRLPCRAAPLPQRSPS
jgi:signal transduction histidine kinase